MAEMTENKELLHNEAFIDGQNLYYGTTHSDPSWKIDIIKFRKYLWRKFKVERAYYFLGYFDDEQQVMYTSLQDAGFTPVFRKHQNAAASHKKGNVDTDLVFYIMYKLYKQTDIDKVVLVSGDGDFYRVVHFLEEEDKLGKVIFPSRRNVSSLYNRINCRYRMFLDADGVKKKIAYVDKGQGYGY